MPGTQLRAAAAAKKRFFLRTCSLERVEGPGGGSKLFEKSSDFTLRCKNQTPGAAKAVRKMAAKAQTSGVICKNECQTQKTLEKTEGKRGKGKHRRREDSVSPLGVHFGQVPEGWEGQTGGEKGGNLKFRRGSNEKDNVDNLE